jgi:thiamine-monophosphate kinase
MTTTVRELALIESLTRQFARSPRQINALQESDAELLTLGNGITLAVTTDTIAEEIATGLYANPWLAGWMTVMANLSDIAAVGAEPLGILIAETFPAGTDPAVLSRVQEGIGDACQACGTWVLGGDTNAGEHLQITGTAVGMVTGGAALTRKGIGPGDHIYCTGPLGGGNAFAAMLLAGKPVCLPFRPVAKLHEGVALRGLASACMDTSDGLMATLDQLGRVNHVGFEMAPDWQAALDAAALNCSRETGLPAWLFLAGPHGEFELVFSVPRAIAPAAGAPAPVDGKSCRYIGRAIAHERIVLPGVGSFDATHRTAIRNLEPPDGKSMQTYIAELLGIGVSAQDSTES